ncbi:MAG: hypothetical protein WBI90_03400 [Acetomicrobium sp.]
MTVMIIAKDLGFETYPMDGFWIMLILYTSHTEGELKDTQGGVPPTPCFYCSSASYVL